MEKIMSKAEYDTIYDETGREFAEEFFCNALEKTMTNNLNGIIKVIYRGVGIERKMLTP
ncbi:MAG: hypothetical protein LBC75_03365 [Fibromonadaceae bacterium]|nr:hypothetical protein [Fibromonadaceae bacterium]